jgi:hypothetical protein
MKITQLWDRHRSRRVAVVDALLARHPNAELSMPSTVVNDMWRELVTDTGAYAALCQGAFGRIVDRPDPAANRPGAVLATLRRAREDEGCGPRTCRCCSGSTGIWPCRAGAATSPTAAAGVSATSCAELPAWNTWPAWARPCGGTATATAGAAGPAHAWRCTPRSLPARPGSPGPGRTWPTAPTSDMRTVAGRVCGAGCPPLTRTPSRVTPQPQPGSRRPAMSCRGKPTTLEDRFAELLAHRLNPPCQASAGTRHNPPAVSPSLRMPGEHIGGGEEARDEGRGWHVRGRRPGCRRPAAPASAAPGRPRRRRPPRRCKTSG